MKRISILYILIICFCFISCSYEINSLPYAENDVSKRISNELVVLDENPAKDKQEYNILIISDLHFGSTKNQNAYKNLFNFLDEIKNKSPKDFPQFVVALGDLTEGGLENEFVEYENFVAELKTKYNLKVYNLFGNHDLYNVGWSTWKKVCYPHESFYKFETDNLSFYCVDTASGIIGKKQYEILKNTMEKDEKNKIVFSHIPLYTEDTMFSLADTYERNKTISLFQENKVKMVVSGHIHLYESFDMGTFFQKNISSFLYNDSVGILIIDEKSMNLEFIEKKTTLF